MTIREIVIFDFDGVLMDSVAEVVVSAFNACTQELFTSVHDIPDGVLNLFRHYRFLMRTPAEALPLMTWCLKRIKGSTAGDLDAESFSQLCKSSPLSAENRRRCFFSARQRMIEKHPSAFLSLNRPFQPLWNYLVDCSEKPIIMLTTKNRQAVLTLCRHFGLAINPENIFSGDRGTTKSANIEAIHLKFAASRYFFIDDLLQNLIELKNGFVKEGVCLSLFLANWGYGTAEDTVLTSRMGFKILDQEGAIDLLGTVSFS